MSDFMYSHLYIETESLINIRIIILVPLAKILTYQVLKTAGKY